MDNANPTVLNASELPTRRGKSHAPSKQDTDSIMSLMQPTTNPAMQIYLDDEEPISESDDDNEEEPIDEQEIFGMYHLDIAFFSCQTRTNMTCLDLISTISDPEHPLSLGSLAVVNLADVHISPPPGTPTSKDALITVLVEITPTITHCSLATVIGLGVRVRLEQALPARYRVDVRIKAGTHSQDEQVNKQLADKERVAAALENATLLKVLMTMLETCA